MASYAIVIGVNDYTPVTEQGLRSLEGAIADARDMAKWLIQYGGVAEENCHVFTSTNDPLNPIKDEIDKAIAGIVNAVLKNDNGDAERLYLYFAGHGLAVREDKENNGMCMANWQEFMADGCSLSSTEYKRKFIAEGLFKEIVIWMDCCREPKVYFNPARPGRIVPGLGPNDSPRYMIAFGSTFGNPAFESAFMPDGKEKRGVFTKVLLDGLKGAAPKAGERLTTTELIDFLHFEVPIAAAAMGFSQEPEISHNPHPGRPMYF